MNSTLSERGQVVIPKACRDALGLQPGQTLSFHIEGSLLLVRKVTREDPTEAVFGILTLPEGTDQAVEALRGSVDLPEQATGG
ncbi:MAG: AbrB/MazE/SpoVT family DNA-binding domain-containing protein [Polyangiales bacterium]